MPPPCATGERPGAPMDGMSSAPSGSAGPSRERVTVGREPLTIDEVVRVARHGTRVVLADEALAEVRRTRAVVRGLADGAEPHYGVSTGFGALATRHIPVTLRRQLQRSLVRSHAAGSGPEVEREVVRALMLLRISTLATGRTGIREETLLAYVAMLDAGLTPVVHEYGSLGCSGDLAPLAHCALALMGEGEVRDASGVRMPSAQALSTAGISPVELEEKEGLALINGTDGMLGMLCLAIADLRELLVVADVTAAMSVEGLLGTDDVFAADLQALRPQPGQAVSAANIRKVMAHSAIRESHRTEAWERRTDRFLDASRSNGLAPFLADDPGVDSGHMIAQYTQAAIVSEMKRLAAPASVDSIPSSAMQEDHVSMGWSAARKLRRSVDGLARVLAVEVLTATRGIRLRAPLTPAPATAAVVDALVSAGAGTPGPDRWLSPEIDTAYRLVTDGTIRRAAESVTGPLT
ncbi:MAG: hutH [Ornithinibacter sp.]|nr:hutH [Ornithinibacter sp.]